MHASFFQCESGRSTFPEERFTLKPSLVVTHKNILFLILFLHSWILLTMFVSSFVSWSLMPFIALLKWSLACYLALCWFLCRQWNRTKKRLNRLPFKKLGGDNCLTGALVLVEPSLAMKNKASLKQMVSFGYCLVDDETETNSVKCCRQCCNRTFKS